MTGLTARWKLFRICCIVQLVLVALQMMLSVAGLFYRGDIIYPITESIAYGIIFFFIYMGLSMLNYNYPDTPLTPRQKRNFNWLYLVNFLLIAYLFAQVITEWRNVVPLLVITEAKMVHYVSWSSMLIINIVIFILHLVFLGGMFQLRKVIYQHTMNNWYNQFDEEKK